MFAILDSPKLLDPLIQRAQKAILNPSKDPHYFTSHFNHFAPFCFLDESAPVPIHHDELKFSKDVICLEITGASTTLTLIDLPGIIHSVENIKENNLIGVIEDLVKEYISNETAIILAVISCT